MMATEFKTEQTEIQLLETIQQGNVDAFYELVRPWERLSAMKPMPKKSLRKRS
jgi:hypothetical protein